MNDKVEWLVDNMLLADGPCLIWPFSRRPDGYGHRFGPKGKRDYPHRFMCRLVHGAPPTSKHETAHSCGGGASGCVHPRHVRWATSKENSDDTARHGTTANGAHHGRAKLSDLDARRIRDSVTKGVDLARYFGVSPAQISRIRSCKRWSHLA